MSHEYEVGFIAENVSQNLPDIKAFAKTIDDFFPISLLSGLTISLWTASDTIGFWLVFQSFDREYIAKFQEWMNRYHIRVLEVMHKTEKEREKIRNEFIHNADLRFVGAFEIDQAFDMIQQKLAAFTK
jgi:hypothetical protein